MTDADNQGKQPDLEIPPRVFVNYRQKYDELPGLKQLAQSDRWCAWRYEIRKNEQTGKQSLNKVPYDYKTGRPKDVTKRESNNDTFTTIVNHYEGYQDCQGPGFTLDWTEDGYAGIDLDGCRNEETGELTSRAKETIDLLDSYTEISPSDTGVKIFIKISECPTIVRHKFVHKKAAKSSGRKDEQTEVHVSDKYFCVTGNHLEGTPEEINDRTEQFTLFMLKLAINNTSKVSDFDTFVVDDFRNRPLPKEFLELLQNDKKMLQLWDDGKKESGDTTASGLDFSLALMLASLVASYDDIATIIVQFAHGQFPGWSGKAADRRLRSLLHVVSLKKAEDQYDAELARLNLKKNRGGYIGNDHNVLTIFEQHSSFKGNIRLETFTNDIQIRNCPWDENKDWKYWTDADDVKCAAYLQSKGVAATPEKIARIIGAVAGDNRVSILAEHLSHCEQEYLNDCKAKDLVPGKARGLLERIATEVLGHSSDDDRILSYAREAIKNWFLQGAARALKPGCKADYMLVLEGVQGALKSTLCRSFCQKPEWFSDQIHPDLRNKDASGDIRGKSVIEMSELSAIRNKETEATKSFITRQTDRYRPPYERRSKDFPRMSIFIGTTNSGEYLHDPTGNRRYWPVKVGTIDLKWLEQHLKLLWGEAVYRYTQAEQYWFDREIEAIAAQQQEARMEYNDAFPVIIEAAAEAYRKLSDKQLLTTAVVMKQLSDSNRDLTMIMKISGKAIKPALMAAGWIFNHGRHPQLPKLGSQRYFEMTDEMMKEHGIMNRFDPSNKQRRDERDDLGNVEREY